MPKKTKTVKARNSAAPDEGVLTNLLTSIEETDGLEVRREMWFLAETLAARGLITLGPQHGQNGDWRRAIPVEGVAQLTEGLGMSRTRRDPDADANPMGYVLETRPAPDFAELEQRTLAAGAEREPVERTSTVSTLRSRGVPFDPPLPPPVPGVEPATAFAERLAHKLCAGEPLPAMVIEILWAVRERDAAIVKAKDDEAYATSVAAFTRKKVR